MLAEPWNFVGLAISAVVAVISIAGLGTLLLLARRAPHKRALLAADPPVGLLPPASEVAPLP